MQSPAEAPTIFTIGHSTRELQPFIDLLVENGIALVADVRTIPRSRRNPQFNIETLPEHLREAGIQYRHVRDLGGLRHSRSDSINEGWRNASFRGFADYMQTDAFRTALQALIDLAGQTRIALMCAEAVPWRCHRSLIADALEIRHIHVEHITGPSHTQPHRLTPFARVEGLTLTYPSVKQETLDI